jgi:hypothetical protein
LGYILGDFFPNSSGHPGPERLPLFSKKKYFLSFRRPEDLPVSLGECRLIGKQRKKRLIAINRIGS